MIWPGAERRLTVCCFETHRRDHYAFPYHRQPLTRFVPPAIAAAPKILLNEFKG
jgi:hypothetical protein